MDNLVAGAIGGALVGASPPLALLALIGWPLVFLVALPVAIFWALNAFGSYWKPAVCALIIFIALTTDTNLPWQAIGVITAIPFALVWAGRRITAAAHGGSAAGAR